MTEDEWSLEDGDDQRNWFVRHKVLGGLGGGAVGLALVLSLIGAATGGAAEVPGSPRVAVPAVPIVDAQTPGPAGTVAEEAAPAEEVASRPAADKGAAKKAAAKKAAAETAAARKAAARKAAAAERKAEEQRSSLPAGTDCRLLAEEAVRISGESGNDVKVIKIRALKVLQDNRKTYTLPTGSGSTLVLSCSGRAVTSAGLANIPILLRMTVDADSDYFVGYRAR
ncbi:hypothetical protein [Actinoplanes sp. M2I2]|uniref:hypothetical protein n=1 Tax=Actinoplanes sp. M2I2 TaxID=1734444 RepID=UPI0020213D98|nr:hypothetical protein [Actinoplanes sp. M2I2]